MCIPKEITIATVVDELHGLKNYVTRHGWQMHWDVDALILTFTGQHPNDGTKMLIIADINGYRALPPAWFFKDPFDGAQHKTFFPKPGTTRGGSGSIFGNNIICAPFNRLAYQKYGGPHGDWGPECWLNVKGHIRETNLAGMFASIIGHLKASPGMNK